MKKLILTIVISLLAHATYATGASDTLLTCFNKLQEYEASIQILQSQNDALKAEVASLCSTMSAQSEKIDSLTLKLTETDSSVVALADSLNFGISSTRDQILTRTNTLSQSITKKSQTGLWIVVAFAVVVAVVAFIFGRTLARRRHEVASLSAKADKLNEEIVNRLSSEMSEMQSLSKKIGAISTASGSDSDTEQRLILTLADRITFMEMTLYKMDSSVRGHKQLSKSIKQMKDNLLANGYEIVDMLGKEYHDGMNVIASFIDDEDIPAGKKIITGVIKPQINYKGKMIQSAQITVSQNVQ